MERNKFTEEQIIRIQKEPAAGGSVSELFPKQGVSDATIYKLKVKCDGMDVSEVKKLGGSTVRMPAAPRSTHVEIEKKAILALNEASLGPYFFLSDITKNKTTTRLSKDKNAHCK